MTTRDLIKKALLMLRVIGAGREPSAAQADQGLSALQGLYDHLANTQAFGPLTPVRITAAYTPAEQEAVSGAYAVTLPTTINDVYTGETRFPKDRSLITVAANVTTVNGVAVTGPQTWLYDATLAEWVALHDLTLNDEAPLSKRFSEGLSGLLAVELSDNFAAELTPRVVDLARRGKFAITRNDPIRAADVDLPLIQTSNMLWNRPWRAF